MLNHGQIIAVLLWALLMPSHAMAQTDQATKDSKEKVDNFADKPFSFSPLQFLGELRRRAKSADRIDSIPPAPKGWISEQDVIELFRHVNSKDACLAPKNIASSISGPDTTLVGIEARRMIHGYLSRVYPPITIRALQVDELKKRFLEHIADQIDKHIRE